MATAAVDAIDRAIFFATRVLMLRTDTLRHKAEDASKFKLGIVPPTLEENRPLVRFLARRFVDFLREGLRSGMATWP